MERDTQMETARAALERRLDNYEAARDRNAAKFAEIIETARGELARFDDRSAEPANDLTEEPPTRPDPPTMARASVELPAPSTAPEAPGLEDAPELVRYVPTPEVLALEDSAEVLQALGKLETPREEHELLSAWAVAGNRAALTAVAVHVGGALSDRAARSLKRLEAPTTPDPA